MNTRAHASCKIVCVVVVALLAGCAADEAAPSLSSTGTPSGSSGAGSDAGTLTDSSAATDAAVKEVAILVDTKSGVGKVCAKADDCKANGLNCYETNASTGAGICSKLCTKTADCPTGFYCNPQSGNLICTPPRYCNACTTSDDCMDSSPGAKNSKVVCLSGPGGGGYCSLRCSLGDPSCPAASTCKQFGTGIDDFACQPDSGKCVGDGTACSTCTGPTECGQGLECYYAATTGERFCAKPCTPGAASGCPSGTLCKQEKGAKTGYCIKDVAGEGVATCSKGDKEFCEPCKGDYECQSGRCAQKNGSKFCAHPAACTNNANCPYGGEATFCVPSDNGVGSICAPPLAWGCQGFLSCLGHACTAEQKCVKGYCTGG